MLKGVPVSHHSCQEESLQLPLHVVGKGFITDTRRAVVVKRADLSDQMLNLQSSKCSLSGSQGMARYPDLCVRVLGVEGIGATQQIICQVLVGIVETAMDPASTAPVVLGLEVVQVIQVIGCIYASPNSDDDAVGVRIIPAKALSLVGVIIECLDVG